jgi:hypothetical protein
MLARFSSKGLLLAVVLGLAVLALGLMAHETAQADPTPTPTPTATPSPTPSVDTHAVVGTSGNPPNIECKWELPDMVSSATDPTIQYTQIPPGHVHDDDMAVVPDADNNSTNGIQVPCSGPPGSIPSMPTGVKHMIQVRPNLEDQPSERRIQLWAAVDSPLGIASIIDVYWDVYHPDGSLKVQVHATSAYNGGRVSFDDGNCEAFGTGGDPDGDMFEAAVHTGQMTEAAADDPINGMIAKCQEGEKALYYSEFQLSKDQMCGEDPGYKIVLTVTSTGGTDTMTNYIDVPCVFALKIDFKLVDWAAISPGIQDVVSGDLTFAPPSDTHPTVKNVGNDGMGLKLHFSKMVGDTYKGEITSFDAKFGRSAATLQSIDPMTASTWYEFDSNEARILCANEVGKLDLSIHPPSPLVPDDYRGTLDVVGVARLGECEGSEHAD